MKKTLSILLTLAMASSLFAGCANTQPAQETTPTVTESPAGTTALQLSGRHWKIGGQVRQTSLYLYYARDKGLFDKAGLDVEIVTVANGPALNEAMNAGQIDAAANGMAGVYALATGNYYYIGDTTINSGGQAMYARTDSDIVKAGKYGDTNLVGSAETVKGVQVLGLGAGPQQFIAYSYAEAMGLTTDDIEFVAMDHAQAYQAFITGQGDLLATTPPYSTTLAADPNYTLVADYKDLAGGPLLDSFVITRELADQYPDDVVAILDCIYTAMDMLANDTDGDRAEYSKNLYQKEGGTTYSDEDIQREISNVTYWTWDQLADSPYDFGLTMTVMGKFLSEASVGLLEESDLPVIKESLNQTFVGRLLEYRASK